MSKSKVKVSFKTPVGELRWVVVYKGGRDVSDAKDGSKLQKQASFVIPKGDKELLAKIQGQLDDAWNTLKAANDCKVAKPKSNGLKEVKDKDTREGTGEYLVEFKTNAVWPDELDADGKPKDVEIPIYDAKGQRIHLGDKKIGNGSIGVIHGEIGFYDFRGQVGISIYLKAIQLVKLVEYNEGAVEVEDYSATEGAFVADVADLSDHPAAQQSPSVPL